MAQLFFNASNCLYWYLTYDYYEEISILKFVYLLLLQCLFLIFKKKWMGDLYKYWTTKIKPKRNDLIHRLIMSKMAQYKISSFNETSLCPANPTGTAQHTQPLFPGCSLISHVSSMKQVSLEPSVTEFLPISSNYNTKCKVIKIQMSPKFLGDYILVKIASLSSFHAVILIIKRCGV